MKHFIIYTLLIAVIVGMFFENINLSMKLDNNRANFAQALYSLRCN